MRLPLMPALLATVLIGLVVALSGCGRGEEARVPASKPYNDADVAFATDMVQHHAEALQLVDLVAGRRLDASVTDLAEEVRMTHAREIEQLVGMLRRWDDQPVPETVRDHANAHRDGTVTDSDLPGTLSSEDLEALSASAGDEFRERWLDLMAEHHEAAIEMAQEEAESGEDRAATALAADIIRMQGRQVKEIERMDRS
jgi:uncharacterized protein (DUF305 family)